MKLGNCGHGVIARTCSRCTAIGILEIANNNYPENCVARCIGILGFKKERVGDTLAEFIVNEIIGVNDPADTLQMNLYRSSDALQSAIRELQRVAGALGEAADKL